MQYAFAKAMQMRRRRSGNFMGNHLGGVGRDLAGSEPRNYLRSTQLQEVLTFPVPIKVTRVLVGLQDHNLGRVLYPAVKVVADVAP